MVCTPRRSSLHSVSSSQSQVSFLAIFNWMGWLNINAANAGNFLFTWLDITCLKADDSGDFPFYWTGIPAESTVLKQVKSWASVSCLINMERLELLLLHPSGLIAYLPSTSLKKVTNFKERGRWLASLPDQQSSYMNLTDTTTHLTIQNLPTSLL